MISASEPSPLPAAGQPVAVVVNRRIARDTFLMRIDAPGLARAIRPGQFLMVRPSEGPPGSTDPLLGRPFALYDVARDDSGEPVAVDIVYLVLGRGTTALARMRPGDRVAAWGPLGNGFGPPPEGDPVAFVAGGIGQTPFVALAKWWLGRARYGESGSAPGRGFVSGAVLYYGTRSADLLAGLDDFRAAGVIPRIATDDGSSGHHGFVTDLLRLDLERGVRPAKLVGCGPPPMLRALAAIASEHSIPCDLSLENHMACGFGACFSCVAPIRQQDGSTDLRRVCVEGPIFPAESVVFP